MGCNDVIELTIIPHRHVGGVLYKVYMNKHVESENYYAIAGRVSRLVLYTICKHT